MQIINFPPWWATSAGIWAAGLTFKDVPRTNITSDFKALSYPPYKASYGRDSLKFIIESRSSPLQFGSSQSLPVKWSWHLLAFLTI